MSTDQDLRFLHETQLLAALHLNSTSGDHHHHHHPPHSAAVMEPFTKLNSNKRQSPSSLSPQHPFPKRAALLHPSDSTNSSEDQFLHGFTRIPLSSPPLSRTLSAPIPSQVINDHQSFSNGGAVVSSSLGTRSPEESSGVNSAAPVATPSQQPINRSFSEPIPESYLPVATSPPPRPPVAGKVARLPRLGDSSGLSLVQESPDAKRLKRMKERIKEINKWWAEMVKEGEEDEGSENNDHCLHNVKDDTAASQVSETEEGCQEAVWVERKGETLILHFKCPCTKGYQILLSGNNCYYKLTSF